MTAMTDIALTTQLRGLAAMGLTNVGKLIAHLPMRHEREEGEAPISQLQPGQIIAARGDITATRVTGFGRKKRFEAVLHDGDGRIDLIFFNQAYLNQKIGPGTRLWVQGTLKERSGTRQLANPRFKILYDDSDVAQRDTRYRPVYPATERIESRRIERAIRAVLDQALPLIEDHLSEDFLRKREMPKLRDAYRIMHNPKSGDDYTEARRRLAFDELLLLQLGVHLKRAHLRRTLTAPALPRTDDIDQRIKARIPFELTHAQQRVIEEIAADITTSIPANRLVQGDVGSGKTVIALYAMLLAVAAGKQAALMAPTALLAEQHYLNLSELLTKSGTRVELLTGSLTEQDRAGALSRLKRGETNILIGTHALLTDRVQFNDLALVVIDEQHRFGVVQRANLRSKGAAEGDDKALAESVTPHVIVMTATPIPRTLAMTILGDLDVSTIDGLPPGRKPVKTRVVDQDTRPEVYDWLRTKLDEGDQAFIVTPTIDEAENMPGDGPPPANLTGLLAELEQGPLKGKRVAAVHGRMKRQTREHIMGRFRAGLIDAIVATTVIEVGVDVPNATVMVIESAERFGLAQLHQLRGRVGRGDKPSACILVASATTDNAAARLEVMAQTDNGFELADKDLEIRGPGELFGVRQSGLPPFEVADLTRDLELLRMARDDAREWIDRSPRLADSDDTLARRRVLKRYGKALGLGDVG